MAHCCTLQARRLSWLYTKHLWVDYEGLCCLFRSMQTGFYNQLYTNKLLPIKCDLQGFLTVYTTSIELNVYLQLLEAKCCRLIVAVQTALFICVFRSMHAGGQTKQACPTMPCIHLVIMYGNYRRCSYYHPELVTLLHFVSYAMRFTNLLE